MNRTFSDIFYCLDIETQAILLAPGHSYLSEHEQDVLETSWWVMGEWGVAERQDVDIPEYAQCIFEAIMLWIERRLGYNPGTGREQRKSITLQEYVLLEMAKSREEWWTRLRDRMVMNAYESNGADYLP